VLLISYAHTAAKAATDQVASTPTSVAGDAEEGDAAADEGALAPATPDKRDKRKRKGKKAAAGAVGVGGGSLRCASDGAVTRLALVELVLRCAAVVWESVAGVLGDGHKAGRKGGPKGGAASASSVEASEERSGLAAALGTPLASLYELLLDTAGTGGGGYDGGEPAAVAEAKAVARVAVLRLASCLTIAEVPLLPNILVSGLSSGGAAGGDVAGDFAPAVALLCKWGQVSAVAGLMAESLAKALAGAKPDDDDDAEPEAGKRKRGKKPKAAAAAEASPMPLALSVRLLRFLAGGVDGLAAEARAALLGGGELEGGATALFAALTAARGVLLAHCSEPTKAAAPSSDTALLVACVELHGRLLLHRHAAAKDAASAAEMEEWVAFAARNLLPLALRDDDEGDDGDGSDGEVGQQGSEAGAASPPAKTKRPSGTTPAKHKTAAALAAVTAPPSKLPPTPGEAQSGPALAGVACGAMLVVCGDWAACCFGTGPLSSAAAVVVTDLLAASARRSPSGGAGDLCVPDHAKCVVSAAGRLAFLLAAAEPQDRAAKAPPEALRLLFNAAHWEDDSDTGAAAYKGSVSLASPRRLLERLVILAAQNRSMDMLAAKVGAWLVDATSNAAAPDPADEAARSADGALAACLGPGYRGAAAAAATLLAHAGAAKALVGWLLARAGKVPLSAASPGGDAGGAAWLAGSGDARVLAACCKVLLAKGGPDRARKDQEVAAWVMDNAKKTFPTTPSSSAPGAQSDPRRALLGM